jgi:predicted NUDIX family NTP pyrophosphohydrolase
MWVWKHGFKGQETCDGSKRLVKMVSHATPDLASIQGALQQCPWTKGSKRIPEFPEILG